MRLDAINLRADSSRGLSAIRLDRLGSVVALVGRNGSGKTRVLDLLFERISSCKFPYYEDDLIFDGGMTTVSKGCDFVVKIDSTFFNTATERIKKFISQYNESRSLGAGTQYEEFRHRFIQIQQFFKALVGKELPLTQHGDCGKVGYGGRFIDDSLLSPGERELFYYAWLIFAHGTDTAVSASEKIYIIDEPEAHLHPSAHIRIIEGIRSLLGPKGQLWIATHSLTIISHLSVDEIVLIENNAAVNPSSKATLQAVESLMGVSENLAALDRFTTRLAEWAYGEFVLQCLYPPRVASPRQWGGDIQMTLIEKTVTATLIKNGLLSILDIGAGRGRLYESLLKSKFSRQLRYVAFEPDENYKKTLQLRGIPVVADMGSIPEASIDIAILCNVLHEVEPTDWCALFTNIARLLGEEGVLLIVEDTLLPTGEHPNETGFIVIDRDSAMLIFGGDERIEQKEASGDVKGRILGITVPRAALALSTQSAVIKALSARAESAYCHVKRLKEAISVSKPSRDASEARLGRQLAYYSQLHINCRIALDRLTVGDE